MALRTGPGRRSRFPLSGTRGMCLLGLCKMNIDTKAIRLTWDMRPTLTCVVYWITCPKPNG